MFARQIALGGAPLQLGPVSVRTTVQTAVAGLPSAVRERLVMPNEAESGDTICCADPVWLPRMLLHLVLEAACSDGAPEPIELRSEIKPAGEAHFIICAPDRSLLAGSAAELGAVKSLLELMGGDLVLEPRRAGVSPLRLILRALPSAERLRRAA